MKQIPNNTPINFNPFTVGVMTKQTVLVQPDRRERSNVGIKLRSVEEVRDFSDLELFNQIES